jgi:anti-sigma factor RsiW
MERLTGHSELQELLGAYALDAVEPDEAEMIERHLEVCPRCRTELTEHREVAALLGYAGATAPAGLWDRITASLEEPPPALRLSRTPVEAVTSPQLPSPAPATPAPLAQPSGPNMAALPRRPEERTEESLAPVVPIGRGRKTVEMRMLIALASVAAVIVALLGVQLGRMQRPGSTTPTRAGVFQAAADTPGARLITLKSPDNADAVNAVVLPDGTSYLGKGKLPALPSNETYQLWGVVGADKISLGVPGRNAEYAAFTTPSDVSALAITVEDNPAGVVTSSKTPVVAGSLLTS